MSNTSKADHYNDPNHNYQKYWQGRDYEHQAEILAIKRLLKGKKFKVAVDIGGGYGRLEPLLVRYADKVILAEPSQQQLDLADKFLKEIPDVSQKLMQAEDLKFESGSVNLVVMVRVMHHLPDPTPALEEISRVLTPGGSAIIEVANYMHAKNRLKYLLKGKRFPVGPVDIRTAKNLKSDDTPFVNHNPHTVITQLAASGLVVDRIMSVSNLRYPGLKKVLPRRVMLAIEGILQPTLSTTFFGPSIFFLVHKS
jgi:SAM-dependent methyltransferase